MDWIMNHNYNKSLVDYYKVRIEALVKRIEELEKQLREKNGTNIK